MVIIVVNIINSINLKDLKELPRETPEEIKMESLGEYKISHYCLEKFYHICNSGGTGITSSGTIARENRTIATDLKFIPYNTKVSINDVIYTAEDTGGNIKGKRIDIAVETHAEALILGIKYVEVFRVLE
jgi:3D (Asp-Asp-Asp) domain-containing protein